jgi:hypothetical protein
VAGSARGFWKNQPHVPLEFRAHQAKGPLNAGLTGCCQRKEVEAARTNRLGAQRKRFQHMRSALDSSVHDHVDLVAHGIDDFSQLIERGA